MKLPTENSSPFWGGGISQLRGEIFLWFMAGGDAYQLRGNYIRGFWKLKQLIREAFKQFNMVKLSAKVNIGIKTWTPPHWALDHREVMLK